MAPQGDGLPFDAALPRPAAQDLPREHGARVELPPTEGPLGAHRGDGAEEHVGARRGSNGGGRGCEQGEAEREGGGLLRGGQGGRYPGERSGAGGG